MDFQTIRIYGSVAIILGCFIFLYPKLLHPMFSTLLGLNSEDQKSDDSISRHPDMGGSNPSGGDLPEHIRKMRHGPHPGMRATAAEQAKQAKGSGRGMMGIILPMYAIGIVVYLVYTLFKVFGKNDKGENNRRSPIREPEVTAYDSGPKGEEQGMRKMETVTQRDLVGQLEKLQSLANSVKSSDTKEMDMRKLQERLAETEARMSQILTAMQSVQNKVGGDEAPPAKSAAPQAKSAAPPAESAAPPAESAAPPAESAAPPAESAAPPAESATRPAQTQKEEPSTEEGDKTKEAVNVSDRSSESSPETESYEIVNKSDRESSGEENAPKSVETLTSTVEEELQPELEDEDDEMREVILKDKEDSDDGVPKSVRKRVPKMEVES